MTNRAFGRWGVPVAFAILFATAGLTISAQSKPGDGVAAPSTDTGQAPPVSVQDALDRRFDFPFAKPTALDEVAVYLGKALNAPVAIDRAAISRLELKVDDTVQLQLEGVRLKTGLKLLLDQLEMTYRVVPEDNLLILTDTEGTHEPIDDVLVEIKSLHREMHDVQDAIDDLRAGLGLDGEPGAQMRKPTIIEEVPGEEEPKVKKESQGPVSPKTRPS